MVKFSAFYEKQRSVSVNIVLLSLTLFDIDFNFFKNIFFTKDEFVRTYKEKQIFKDLVSHLLKGNSTKIQRDL